ncbi:hypothetical protein CU097_008213 [Rhizopus azygosporus]|uniref:Uncharacterized protein n=1 Tax=Rhizopus azygosporus TaxID=86630 RepID=A0A367JEW5_RHIAZ|nr:hypothetical protein CU097_008213 [Rhizopus azygosporus]
MSAFRDACKARGQNAYIGAELENMLSKFDGINITQSECRLCDTSSGTNTAKLFIWDALEVIKSVQDIIGPVLGINTKEELDIFLEKYKHDLETKESVYRLDSVAVKKL